MTIDYYLLGARAAVHFLTFLCLAAYCDPSARHRPVVSLVAVVVCGLSFAAAVNIVTTWPRGVCGPQWIQLAMSSIALVLVVQARGNIAKFFPRHKWGHHV